jgi:Heterokaryon incompatibility protein (HET)
MPICEICASSIQKLRPQAAGEFERREIAELPPPVKVTLPTFRHAGVDRCWICLKFAEWLEVEDRKMFKDWHTRPLRVTYFTHSRGFANQPELLLPFCLVITPEGHQRHGTFFDAEVNFIHARDYVKPATVALRGRGPVGVDFDLIKTWIDRCTKDHKKCRVDTEVWYPSRLLHLDRHTRIVKLILTKHKLLKGHYMTLSHRWGPTSYVQLESSTMAQLQKNVDVAGLPKVFQDTIALAYYLGIQYLWIDALCIKQGPSGRSDWEIESRNMGKIYSNAFINVSATLSSDGSESLLHERACGPIIPSEIEFDVNGKIQKYYALDGDLWFDEIGNAPLSKRGWVFQERFLARRVLHFGERQLGWECRELDALEIFPAGLPQCLAHSQMIKEYIYDELATLTREPDKTLGKGFVDQWHNLVSEYSKSELTFGTDKVVAFAGVAECMMRYRTDPYTAGMWQDTLVYDLAWWRSAYDRTTMPIGATHSRAPSWSWACVDGEIRWPNTMGGIRHKFTDVLEFSKSGLNEDTLAEPKSIRTEAVCLPLGVHFSSGNVASIEVAGFCFPVEDVSDGGSYISLEGSDREIRLLVRQGKVSLLVLFASKYFLYGAVLAETRGVGAYRRLGTVQLQLMRESVAQDTESTRRSKRSGISWPKQESWILDRRPEQPDQIGVNEFFWNENTVKLMYYVRDKQRPRIIEIF